MLYKHARKKGRKSPSLDPVDVDAVNHIEFGLPLLPQGDHVDLVASPGKGLGVAPDPIVALTEGMGEHEA